MNNDYYAALERQNQLLCEESAAREQQSKELVMLARKLIDKWRKPVGSSICGPIRDACAADLEALLDDHSLPRTSDAKTGQ